MKRRAAVVVTIGIAVAIVALAAAPYIVSRGTPAPDFIVETIQGEELTLDDLRGRIILLDFMATWCIPCRLSMPEYVRVYATYAGKIELISISIDPAFDSRSTLRRFADQYRADWVFARDTSLQTQRDYQVVNIPTLVLIDQNGYIRFRFSYTGGAFLSADQIGAEIDNLLEQT